jgi:ABC-2 type transport system ATP-binding protein
MAIIQVENLSKRFGKLVAVDHVDFEIEEGEIFGFLGPNGAGKTTTLSILSTLLKPTTGKATVNGYDVIKQQSEVRRSIGVVFQDPTLDEELTAEENMDFHGRLYGMPGSERRDKISELLELVELESWRKKRVKTFSGGMKRRLEIARGIMHGPKILFLDEPTLGLDPQTKNHLWNYIQNLADERKVTIILTTHYMDEADKLSDTIAIIDNGQIVARDTPNALKDIVGGSCIRIRSNEPEAVVNSLSGLNWISQDKSHDGQVDITVKDPKTGLPEIFKKLVTQNIPVDSISMHSPSLEDVFLHYTGKTIREEEASTKDRMRKRYSKR